MSKVEAFIAVEMNPGPLFAEESVKDLLPSGLSYAYRNIVAWHGGKLQLSDKNLVKRFWYGSVAQSHSAHSDKQKELEAEIAEKDKDIHTKVEMMRLKDFFVGHGNHAVEK